MITKKIAGDLYGNNFMLQNKKGVSFSILGIQKTFDNIDCLRLRNENHIGLNPLVSFEGIGTDYHILARPLSDLTKEITHKGETFVSIVELGKISYPNKNDFKLENSEGGFLCDGWLTTFYFENNEFKSSMSGSVKNHDSLFEKLHELNFAIGLPEGSWIPVTDNNNPYK